MAVADLSFEAPRGAAAMPLDSPKDDTVAVERIAHQFVRGKHGYATLPTGTAAALRRLNPADVSRSAWALMPVLVAAGLPAERMSDDRLRRWALVIHVVAILAGTGGAVAHDRDRPAGRAIQEAGYSEHRFMRLLTARGPALADQVTRLARMLGAKRAVPLDLRPLATLILADGREEERAEAARLALARSYYGVGTAAERQSDPEPR
jgi:CRISPR system Cascade subunit CasB